MAEGSAVKLPDMLVGAGVKSKPVAGAAGVVQAGGDKVVTEFVSTFAVK